MVVRDALTMGPRRGEDTITPHTRPPADEDAEHMLVRTVECIDGSVEVELVCEPVFDYGRDAGRVDAGRRRPAHRRRDAAPAQTIRLQTDMALGIEGDRVRARHVLREGERLFCALSWAEGLAVAGGRRRRRRRALDGDDALLARAGWAARGSPTTAGASRSSARR